MERTNFAEDGLRGFKGREKSRPWKGTTKAGRAWADQERLSDPDSKCLPPKAAELHEGSALGKGETEINLPTYFFERTLASAAESTFIMTNSGLSLIREIKSGKKEWKPKEGADKRHINTGILDNIAGVNADDEKVLTEIKRLRSIQAYNLYELREKLNSDSEIIRIKNSGKPESEAKKELMAKLKEKLQEQVRKIFKEDKIANAGEAIKAALYLESCVRRGFVDVVDSRENGSEPLQPPEDIPVLDGKKEEKGLAELEKELGAEIGSIDESVSSALVNEYENELNGAIERWNSQGVDINKQIVFFRLSYISSNSKRFLGKELAPEKADLFREYLDEKLPKGLPSEKMKAPEVVERGAEEIKKIELSPEQQKQLDDFCDVVKKEYSERFLSGNFRESTFLWEVQTAFRVIFAEDYITEGIFSETDKDAAIKFVLEKVEEMIKV